jgi:hypothetical protein
METNHAETLKHVLCGALIHLEALAHEIKKLDIKEKAEENDPVALQRAKILHLTMIGINDIIHPAHELLSLYFKGNDDYFGILSKTWERSKKDGMAFKGCLCPKCGVTGEPEKPSNQSN